MGKHIIGQPKDTRIIYKKSNSLFCTGHSLTGSDASQYAAYGILKTKNISRNNAYYTDGDKIKRDLSIETDICILRRYCRRRRNMYSVHEASSGKTRCSTVVDTEIETGDEFKPDASACGDSRTKSETLNQNPPSVDITSLMLENLKSLLNDWISKHILEDGQTKKKLIHILDSILQNLETKASSRSSCSTYVLDRNGEDYRVKNMKTATNPLTCQYCKQKQARVVVNKSSSMLCKKFSRFTIPFPYKHLRIISTLSIPRNLNRFKREKVTSKTQSNFYRKNSLSCDKRSKKVTIDLSSYKITPSKKRTVRARNRRKKFQTKRRGLVIFPELFYESTTDCLSISENDFNANANSPNKQNIYVETIPSLVKSIYADDPANVTSTDKLKTQENTNNTFTMTETNESHIYTQHINSSVPNVQYHGAQYECCKQSTITSNIINNNIHHSLESAKLRKKEHFSSGIRKKPFTKSMHRKYEKCKKMFKKPKRKFRNQVLNFDSIKYNQFTYLYRKSNNSNLKSHEFISHLQKVFKYFAEYKGKRNIKLEVHVDVFPSIEIDESLTECTKEPFESFDINVCTTKKNVNSVILTEVTDAKKSMSKNAPELSPQPEIIPLLDVAVSQSKYIFTSDNCTYKTKDIDTTSYSINRGTIMTSLDVCKELHDLKVAIKDLSATTEQIMSEHLKWQCINFPPPELPRITIDNEIPTKPLKTSHCKGIQISNTFVKGQLTSGLKLSKEPKKRDDFIHRLKKRSSSYHVIESEAIIKVTDMTSSVIKPNELKGAFPIKTQSLQEVCNDSTDQNLIAFFCDDDPNRRLNYQIVNTQRKKKAMNGPYAFCNNRTQQRDDIIVQKVEEYQCHNLSSESMELAIAKPTILIRNRGAVTFLEGCLYCIVLWIPLIAILVFFYLYVLDDLINPKSQDPKKSLSVGLMKFNAGPNTESYSKNSSLFSLKLSDIGF